LTTKNLSILVTLPPTRLFTRFPVAAQNVPCYSFVSLYVHMFMLWGDRKS